MYLVSVYFDEKTEKRISNDIRQIAEKTGNTFMIENHVPPHMTVSSIEARDGGCLVSYVEKAVESLVQGPVSFVSIGAFFPYVLYMAPVLSAYLQEVSKKIYNAVYRIPETTVSRFYQPMQWFPHITLGKTLSKEEMQIAFEIMQARFAAFDGKIVSVGLAKTNPHEDIRVWTLRKP